MVGFFRSVDLELELAVYLIENAIMLERIIIDPDDPLLVGSPWLGNGQWHARKGYRNG